MPTLCIDASLNTPAPPVPPSGSCAGYVDAGVSASCSGSVSDLLTAWISASLAPQSLEQVHPDSCLVDYCMIAMDLLP